MGCPVFSSRVGVLDLVVLLMFSFKSIVFVQQDFFG